jgi:hypothetical protein
MSLYRPPLLPIILLISGVALGQTRGGGRPATFTNPATDARNAAVMGKGDNSSLSTVRLSSANDEPRVEFRSQTVLIQVPVIVTNKSGEHLHGLRQEDFSIFENGKLVNVANFEELTASAGKLTSPPAPAGQFRNLTLVGNPTAQRCRDRTRHREYSFS